MVPSLGQWSAHRTPCGMVSQCVWSLLCAGEGSNAASALAPPVYILGTRACEGDEDHDVHKPVLRKGSEQAGGSVLPTFP